MTELIIIAVYLCLLLILGIFASRMFRGTSEDYTLASHSIGPFLLLMSIFGTTMTAFALVGSTGEAFSEGIGVYGMLASSSGIIHSLCFFVIGVKLWSFGRRYGYRTQIQYFRDRLESDKIGVILFPILVGLVIPYLLIGVMASGSVIEAMTKGALPQIFADTGGGVPKWLGSLCICGVVLIYVFFGGMRGTAWANAFQTIVFMVLGVVTFYVVATQLGQKIPPGDHGGFLETLGVLSQQIPEEKATRVGMSQVKFFTYLLVPLSVGMFPHLFQHWLTAQHARSFKLAVVAHPIFIMIVWVPCVLIGVWAASGIVPVPPPVAANQNVVLPWLVKSQTGPLLGGFLTAGILAAIMSSLDSQFLAIGTMFTTDIVIHYGGKKRFTDTQQVWIARAFIVMIVAITYGLSLFEPRSVFDLGVWCFSGFASLFPLVFASVYWRRLTKWGGYASIIATIVAWSILFYRSGFGKDGDYSVDFTINGVTYETMPVATIFLCSLVAMVVVSLLTPPPAEKTVARFFKPMEE